MAPGAREKLEPALNTDQRASMLDIHARVTVRTWTWGLAAIDWRAGGNADLWRQHGATRWCRRGMLCATVGVMWALAGLE